MPQKLQLVCFAFTTNPTANPLTTTTNNFNTNWNPPSKSLPTVLKDSRNSLFYNLNVVMVVREVNITFLKESCQIVTRKPEGGHILVFHVHPTHHTTYHQHPSSTTTILPLVEAHVLPSPHPRTLR
eukprot:TRINITY_DN6340_c0_g1_i1.p1 TRINITY_DN6340_c0_g1~~TRINITY_DN6340_c0_g1_i1.p1  ORF type:complete len:126 (+),score=24.48 TRINITY_DN6340_c0_g1_i1:131-508(+)